MMRTTKIDHTIDSDVDLTRIGSRRVRITDVGAGRYRVHSDLLVHRCEVSGFVTRYLRRRLPGMVAYSGQASCPSGYFWTHPPGWFAEECAWQVKRNWKWRFLEDGRLTAEGVVEALDPRDALTRACTSNAGRPLVAQHRITPATLDDVPANLDWRCELAGEGWSLRAWVAVNKT